MKSSNSREKRLENFSSADNSTYATRVGSRAARNSVAMREKSPIGYVTTKPTEVLKLNIRP
uniref:Uncharacterized protein n=1 Tax=Romanomermis culicivorax TaxID=13658 RepID=A0A915I1Z3_ROMCU